MMDNSSLPEQHSGASGAASAKVKPPPRPKIQLSDRQLRAITAEVLAALQVFNLPPTLFVRNGKAVCITEDENHRHVISDASERILRNRATKAANFFRATNQGDVAALPPIEILRDLLSLPPLQWQFPPLEGVIGAPALRENGTVIDTPGYDSESRIF